MLQHKTPQERCFLWGPARRLRDYVISQLQENVFSVGSVSRLYHEGQRNKRYSHESRATRNQESPCWQMQEAIYWNGLVSNSATGHFPVEGDYQVADRPLLSSKRRPHFDTHKILQQTNIWSWVND
jgi:hypothetical protein